MIIAHYSIIIGLTNKVDDYRNILEKINERKKRSIPPKILSSTATSSLAASLSYPQRSKFKSLNFANTLKTSNETLTNSYSSMLSIGLRLPITFGSWGSSSSSSTTSDDNINKSIAKNNDDVSCFV